MSDCKYCGRITRKAIGRGAVVMIYKTAPVPHGIMSNIFTMRLKKGWGNE